MYLSLQACRAARAALVVLFHLGGTFAQDKYFGFKALDGPFAWGDAGVEFFFVLSGFLITITHRRDFGKPERLGTYVFKRGLRIYPTYWLICIAVCVGALAVPSLRQALPTDWASYLKTFALIPQDPAVVGGTGAPILFVAWSLHYEMLFYVLMAAFIASRFVGIAAIVALLAVYASCWSEQCTFPRSFFASNLIFIFAMGVASAYLTKSRFRLPKPLLIAGAAALAFVAFGAFEVIVGRDSLGFDRRLVYGALSFAIVTGLAQAEDAGTLQLRNRWVDLLGNASYALYLLHIPIISVLCKLLLALGVSGRLTLVAAFVGIFIACVAASVVFYRLIEGPLLASVRGRWGKALGRSPGAGVARPVVSR